MRVHYLLNVSYANPSAGPRLNVAPLSSCQRVRPDSSEDHWRRSWRESGRVRAVSLAWFVSIWVGSNWPVLCKMIDIVDGKHRKHMSYVSKCCVKCLLGADFQMCPVRSILFRHSVVLWLFCDKNQSQFPWSAWSVTVWAVYYKQHPPCKGPVTSFSLVWRPTLYCLYNVRTKTLVYIADMKVKRRSLANLRTICFPVGNLLYFDSIRKGQLSLLRWRAHIESWGQIMSSHRSTRGPIWQEVKCQ